MIFVYLNIEGQSSLYDIFGCYQAKGACADDQGRLEHQKLHVRWRHTSVSRMQNTLRAVALPHSILDACIDIVDIVKTCKHCRAVEEDVRAERRV